MTFKKTKEEQNQTLSKVPLDRWADFKSECAQQRVPMTEGFLKAFKLWEKANAEENLICSFCKKTKLEIGRPVFKGQNGNICYNCVAEKKKELDKG